ncbi:iron chaperone [Alkalibacillus salilacus]|uniref:Uncharacterized protein YdhG (YjbR/CyaY superfamily) n=1 Tax=Alkalibacillus salilacus TaxID=284582 RepID=A0ABT9VBH0_9BACI|nr:iron chaperone [Alkalibacillus salilacus]MDQ0158320.1 uncharacterized protein YdhG (YjbR/CyaY superfamily) [Alkalibacillus salilacus]
MEVFKDYLAKIDDPNQKERMETVLNWVKQTFPQLEPVVKWNQPMFQDHGTFIIAFSMAKHHMSIAPERVALEQFLDEIKEAGYETTKELLKIKWKEQVDYQLLEKMIAFNIEDKQNYTKFWR